MDKTELLFYSNRCQHSRGVLDLLQARGLAGRFLLVCVDPPVKYPLPPFVDRVPLVYRRQTHQVLTEASIPHFINTLAAGQQSAAQQQQPPQQSAQQQPGELMAYSDFVTNGKISDSFGFLDENESGARANSSYIYLGGDGGGGSAAPPSLETVNVDRGSRFDQHLFDSYISKRDADLNSIRSAQPRPI